MSELTERAETTRGCTMTTTPTIEALWVQICEGYVLPDGTRPLMKKCSCVDSIGGDECSACRAKWNELWNALEDVEALPSGTAVRIERESHGDWCLACHGAGLVPVAQEPEVLEAALAWGGIDLGIVPVNWNTEQHRYDIMRVVVTDTARADRASRDFDPLGAESRVRAKLEAVKELRERIREGAKG